MNRSIILVGFMGCGKSYWMRRLSERYGVHGYDTDRETEKMERKTVAKIFKDYGEPYFRHLETQAAQQISRREPSIIATGGGLILREVNRKIMAECGEIVFLDTPFEVCLERIRRNDRRPVANKRSDGELRELYDGRRSAYIDACNVTIDLSLGEAAALKVFDDLAGFKRS